MRCPGCGEIADPEGPEPTMLVGGVRWHFAHMDVRDRLGLDECLPPIGRPAKRPLPPPVSQDPEAIRRLRGR